MAYDDIGEICAGIVIDQTYQQFINAVFVEIDQEITFLLSAVLKILRHRQIVVFLFKAVLDSVAVIVKCLLIPLFGYDLTAGYSGNESQ